jgi:hypothetical protein
MDMDYLDFGTHHWEMLNPDIKVLDLFEYVCELGKEKPLSTIEQYEAIIGWIRRHRGEHYVDKKSIVDVLGMIKRMHPHMSYKTIGELVGWDYDQVYNVLKRKIQK